ncbi:MAG: MarC family protein [Flavobacteriales bacterium]|nr:MarC family protein [Flavobacteriales bacterium]
MEAILKTLIILWAVIDPIGTIPVFLEATKNFNTSTKKKVAINAVLIASGILLFFLIAGQFLLEYMQISLPAFEISGGFVLFVFALTMIFGQGKPEEEKNMIRDYKHVTVFPIAIPSIASPGAITAIVLLTDNNRYTIIEQLITSVLMMVILGATLLLLLLANRVQKKIGDTGIIVISKIMGLILAAVAIESILAGIKAYYSL